MDSNEFGLGLLGDPIRAKDGARIRSLVSLGVRQRARERRKEGRPDIAGRLIYAAGQINQGKPVKKSLLRKISIDIALVESRLVDGVSIADFGET